MSTYSVVLYVQLVALLAGFGAGMIETVCLFRLRAVRHAGGGAVGGSSSAIPARVAEGPVTTFSP